MSPEYRRSLAAVAVAFLVVFAGCTGVLVDRRAAPAAISDDDARAVGYGPGAVVAVPVAVPLAFGPVVREVRVTGYLAAYTAPDRDAAVFVLSTPDDEVGGESVNPFVHLSDPDTVETALDVVRETAVDADASIGAVSDLRPVAVEERTVLGSPATVTTYAATTTAEDGTTTEVRVHVAVVRHDGDAVLAVAVHDADSDETDAVARLFERIEHPADVAVTTPPGSPPGTGAI